MLCQGTIQEQNKIRACWLPAQPASLFQLCRRCHFHKVTSILDSFTRNYSDGTLHPPYEVLFNDTIFLNELLHPAREQALLNCLSALFIHNKIQFQHAIKKLRSQTVFSIVLTKRIENHNPSSKCSMYRYCMRDIYLYTSKNICWNCWSCIAYMLGNREPRFLKQFSDNFVFNYRRLNTEVLQTVGTRKIIDIFVSLFIQGQGHYVRFWLDHLFLLMPLESFKLFLLQLLQHPCMLFLVYTQQKENFFIPQPLQDKVVVDEFKRIIKRSIKEKMHILREDLMKKTWHPSRLFPWCLDIEDWKEHGISSHDCQLVYGEFNGR